MTFKVVSNHIYGPTVTSDDGWLVDNGPLESIERICAALNAAMTADLNWGVPEWLDLEPNEAQRVIRALAKICRTRA